MRTRRRCSFHCRTSAAGLLDRISEILCTAVLSAPEFRLPCPTVSRRGSKSLVSTSLTLVLASLLLPFSAFLLRQTCALPLPDTQRFRCCRRRLLGIVCHCNGSTTAMGTHSGISAPKYAENSVSGAPEGDSAPKSCKNIETGAAEGDFAPKPDTAGEMWSASPASEDASPSTSR